MRLLIVLAILSFLLAGCDECGPDGEPALDLIIYQTNPFTIDTLYTLDSQQPLPSQPYSVTALNSAQQRILPINLNADKTRYVFQISGRKDTLTVFYTLDFAYRNRRCGYVLSVKAPPDKSPDQQVQITRGKIQNVWYMHNQDGAFLKESRKSGISLSIRL